MAREAHIPQTKEQSCKGTEFDKGRNTENVYLKEPATQLEGLT